MLLIISNQPVKNKAQITKKKHVKIKMDDVELTRMLDRVAAHTDQECFSHDVGGGAELKTGMDGGLQGGWHFQAVVVTVRASG